MAPDVEERSAEYIAIRHFSPSDDPYHQEFLVNGYTPTSIPALAFQFTKQKELCEILKQPHEYGGLILTSQRAVDALQKVMLEFLSETRLWLSRNVSLTQSTGELEGIGYPASDITPYHDPPTFKEAMWQPARKPITEKSTGNLTSGPTTTNGSESSRIREGSSLWLFK